MEYDETNLVKDFFRRTKENLDLYMKNKAKSPDVYTQEVTMTINSLLGMLVFVQQDTEGNNLMQHVEISKIINKAVYGNANNDKTVKDFFRHMRNSIAHGHCIKDFKVDEQHQITSLIFRDFHKKDKTFEVELELSDITYLINAISAVFCR